MPTATSADLSIFGMRKSETISIGLLPLTGFTEPVFTFFYFIDCQRFISIPRWLPAKRCDASNFKKSVTFRISDILTTFQ